MSGLARIFIVAAGLLLTAAGARAQIFSWTNSAGGTFGTAANWSPAGPPSTAAHTAIFNLPTVYSVSMGNNHTAGTLSVGSAQFGMTFNMFGRTLNFPTRVELSSDLTLSGGGVFGGAGNTTTLRDSVFNVNGSLVRAGTLTLGLNGPGASTGSFSAATLEAQNVNIGEVGFGNLRFQNNSVATLGLMNIGQNGSTSSGRMFVNSNSIVQTGTLNVGVQGAVTADSRIEVSGGGRVTMAPGSPLVIGGSSVQITGLPLTLVHGGIVRLLSSGGIGGTGGTFTTSSTPTIINYGGLLDIQMGSFHANGDVNSDGRISIASSGFYIAPMTQTTTINGQLAGATSGSATFGLVPGLDVTGTMTAGTLVVGSVLGSDGWAQIASPSISLNHGAIVGASGIGRLDAGRMSVGSLVIGANNSGNGIVNVGTFTIGTLGIGTLNSGTLNVGSSIIGQEGNGTLRIEASSQFTPTGNTTLGDGGDGDGTIILQGSGSITPARFEAPGQVLMVGRNGRGTLAIGGNSSLNVATLHIGPAPVVGSGLGTMLQSGGTVSTASPLIVQPNGHYALSGGTVTSAIQNLGTFVYSGGVMAQPVDNAGTAIINGTLATGAVINNNPSGKLTSANGLIAGNATINNEGTLGGAGRVAAGLTLNNTGTIGSSGGDLIIENGVTFTNNAGSLIRNGPASTLRLRTFLDNNGNIEVNAGGAIETAFSVNVLSGQKLTMKGGLLAVGVGEQLNLSVFPGASVLGFGQINASMFNSGSVLFNGPTQIVGQFGNDGATQVRNATTIIFGPATNNGSITVNNGTIVFEPAFSPAVRGGSSSGNVTGSGALNVQLGGRVVTDSIRQHQLTLNGSIASPAFAFIRSAAAGGDTSVVKALSIAGSPGTYQSQLDLADNALVIDYDGAPPPVVRDYLVSGYANGAWTGMGIASSAAATTSNRALGFANAADIFSSFPAVFAGESVDSTSVLIRYTLYGDANLDRAVTISDFALLAANFNTAATWSRGDFNYDGTTNITDFALLSANFNQSLPAELPRQRIPEPALLGVAPVLGILWRGFVRAKI